MPVRRQSPLDDTAFQARSRERLARLKDATRRKAFPVADAAGQNARQLADRADQARRLKKES